jgi:TolA-binding protein
LDFSGVSRRGKIGELTRGGFGMWARHAIGIALIAMAGVLPASSQAPSPQHYQIQGTVRDEANQAVPDVRVQLRAPGGPEVNHVQTQDDGEFQFNDLASGDYMIEVQADGYEPTKKAVTLSRESLSGVNFRIARPVRISSGDSAGAVVSVHRLGAPRKAQDEYEKGLLLASGKLDYRGAIVEFDRAIKDFPAFYEAYAQEGSAYIMLHNFNDAEAALRKSVELSSGKYPDALFMLAGLLNDSRRFSDAEHFARQLADLDSASWRGHYQLARALMGLKNPDDAEKSAVKASEAKPDNPDIYLVLGNIHIALRDYDALTNDLNTYLKLAPSGPGAAQARKTLEQIRDSSKKQEGAAGEPDDGEPELPHLPPPDPKSQPDPNAQ